MEKIDLNKLREEIDNRKNQQNITNKQLGVNVKQPKKRFLQGLLEAHQTMRETDEVKHVKKVVHRSDEIAGGDISKHISSTPKTQPKQNYVQPPIPINEYKIQEYPERDDNFYAEIERRTIEYNQSFGKQIFPENPQHYIQYLQQNQQPQMQYNQNGSFEDNVINVMEKYFGDNMVTILQSIITNMFTDEKVRNGIINNEDVIREIVINTIKDLKKKKTT